eukprot:6491062-Amphidinium_carterae.2
MVFRESSAVKVAVGLRAVCLWGGWVVGGAHAFDMQSKVFRPFLFSYSSERTLFTYFSRRSAVNQTFQQLDVARPQMTLWNCEPPGQLQPPKSPK